MKAMNLNTKEFQNLMNEGRTILVDYWAPWCTYCRRIAAPYDMVAQQNEGKLVVAKVNIDEEPELSRQERIEVIPTLVLYRDGKTVASIVAPDSKAKIDEFLREHL